MKINDFKVEQWMNDHEKKAIYNLTDTCVKALTWQELMEMVEMNPDLPLDYGDITGSDAVKKAVLKLYTSHDLQSLTMFHGCLEANQHVMDTLLEPRDHIITYAPGYQQFWDYPHSLGVETTILPLREADGWMPNIEELKASIRSNTKMVILNNPNNPTGTVFPQAYMEQLIQVCKEKDIWILCDEVYRGFDDQPSISDQYEKGIATSSLSKVFALPGLRYGWVKACPSLIQKINVRRDYTMISTGPLMDTIAAQVLAHKDEIIQKNKAYIEQNKQIFTAWEQTQTHYHLIMPKAGTVGFLSYDMDISSTELATKLLDQEGIFFVPGSCFGFDHHVRFGLGQDSQMLEKGLQKLSVWTNRQFG